jgi:hypothetical protein
VIIGTITGAESLITLVGILSIPGALFSGKEVIMFSTSEQLILSNKNCYEIGWPIKVNGSACPVWIYTQSNIKNIIFT